jgi:hypothetical protein
MSRSKKLPPIHPGEILFEEFLKPVDSQNLVHAGINANSGATGVLGWSSSSGGFGGLTQLDRSNWSADGLTKAGMAIGCLAEVRSKATPVMPEHDREGTAHRYRNLTTIADRLP